MFQIGDKVLIVNAQKNIDEMFEMIGQTTEIEYGYENSWKLKGSEYVWIDRWLSPVSMDDFEVSETEIMDIMEGE